MAEGLEKKLKALQNEVEYQTMQKEYFKRKMIETQEELREALRSLQLLQQRKETL